MFLFYRFVVTAKQGKESINLKMIVFFPNTKGGTRTLILVT